MSCFGGFRKKKDGNDDNNGDGDSGKNKKMTKSEQKKAKAQARKVKKQNQRNTKNSKLSFDQGKAIGRHGKDHAKILVVGNPANTNAFIGRDAANNESQLWMAMTMLHRLTHQLLIRAHQSKQLSPRVRQPPHP